MSEKTKIVNQNDLMSHQDDFLSTLGFSEEKPSEGEKNKSSGSQSTVITKKPSESKLNIKTSQTFGENKSEKSFSEKQNIKNQNSTKTNKNIIVNLEKTKSQPMEIEKTPAQPEKKVTITINFPSKDKNQSNSGNGNSQNKNFKGNNQKSNYTNSNNSKSGNFGEKKFSTQKPGEKKWSDNKPSFDKKGGKNNFSSSKNTKNNISKTPVFKEQKQAKSSDTLVKKDNIVMGDFIMVKEFSEKIGLPLADVIKTLLKNKIMLGANGNLDFDTANLIGDELGVKVEKQQSKSSITDILEGNLSTILSQDSESEKLVNRAPIVTIMGHVDHGKTRLLDYIRSTNVIGGEAGGITQSIGAYQAEYNGEKITFIDTPGHELFTSLRARGSKVADIVIIVVAADEGIKQQTIEAINHAKDAGVPIIVAITKIDRNNLLPDDMLFASLSEHGLTPESWGGETVVVKLSAQTGEGINELLEMIILQSQLLDLKYNPDRNGIGIVLESHKDTKKGNLTSIILMSGTLKVGDIAVIHNVHGKVRKLYDRKGEEIKVLHGGQPAQMMGISQLPEPGRILESVKNEKEAQKRIESINDNEVKTSNLQNILSRISQGETTTVKLILKADSYGSLEAVKYAIEKISLPENIEIKIVHSDVGGVSDSDLPLAQASGALILGFNISISHIIIKKAEQQKITIKTYDIIYQLIDYIESVANGLVKIEEKEVIIGEFNILGVFFKRGDEMILGGKVSEGKIKNGAKFRSYHGKELLGTGRITSLKIEKENVDEVSRGHECGIRVKVDSKPDVGDRLEIFVME